MSNKTLHPIPKRLRLSGKGELYVSCYLRKETYMSILVITKTAKVVFENAERLLDDAKHLYEWESYPTSYSLFILAQEEYGKTFLLHLLAEGAVPTSPHFDKVLRNHQCKQMVALIMEYMQRKDFLELIEESDRFSGVRSLPPHILDAIHIIVHEHVFGRVRNEWTDQDKKIHPLALRIARGILDREKQSGLYVYVGQNGTMGRTPQTITVEQCAYELARTERVSDVFWNNLGKLQTTASFDLPKIVATFKVLSGLMPVEEFNEHWLR